MPDRGGDRRGYRIIIGLGYPGNKLCGGSGPGETDTPTARLGLQGRRRRAMTSRVAGASCFCKCQNFSTHWISFGPYQLCSCTLCAMGASASFKLYTIFSLLYISTAFDTNATLGEARPLRCFHFFEDWDVPSGIECHKLSNGKQACLIAASNVTLYTPVGPEGQDSVEIRFHADASLV